MRCLSVGHADRNKKLLPINSAVSVEFTTSRVFKTPDEERRMDLLVDLAGIGVPRASALLFFAFPNDYPILDRYALRSLGAKSRRTTYPTPYWIEYLLACRRFAAELEVPIRTLHKALWQFSKGCDQEEDSEVLACSFF
jgi:hypothetical protein